MATPGPAPLQGFRTQKPRDVEVERDLCRLLSCSNCHLKEAYLHVWARWESLLEQQDTWESFFLGMKAWHWKILLKFCPTHCSYRSNILLPLWKQPKVWVLWRTFWRHLGQSHIRDWYYMEGQRRSKTDPGSTRKNIHQASRWGRVFLNACKLEL